MLIIALYVSWAGFLVCSEPLEYFVIQLVSCFTVYRKIQFIFGFLYTLGDSFDVNSMLKLPE